VPRSSRPAQQTTEPEVNIFYIIGVVVVIAIVLSFLGLR
jgi:hypothetical protein